jgi:hypothetical protein
MAAHADTSAPRTWGLRARLQAIVDRPALDRRLATGANPDASPALVRRAHVLSGWRVRRALADGLESVVIEAIAPHHEWSAAVPVQREEVLAAQADLLRLVRALRAEPAPPVRVIAAVSELLTDGAGPVFAEHPPGTLAEAAFQAAFHAEAG